MNEIGVSSEGCLEKSDMLDRLEASSRVELIPECETEISPFKSFHYRGIGPSSSTQPHVYSRSQLMSMTVPEIKDLMARCNLALPEEAVEKEQLLGMLVSVRKPSSVLDRDRLSVVTYSEWSGHRKQ